MPHLSDLSIFRRSAGPVDLDLGLRRVADAGVELSDGGWAAALAIDPIDIESRSPEQTAALIDQLGELLSALPGPMQICARSRRFDVSAFTDSARQQWGGRWAGKLSLRDDLLGRLGVEGSWTDFLNEAAQDLRLREVSARIVVATPAGRRATCDDLAGLVRQITAALDAAQIPWAHTDGLDMAIWLEEAFCARASQARTALQSGGITPLAGRIENLAFDVIDPLPEWIEFSLRSISLPLPDGDTDGGDGPMRRLAVGYLRGLPRSVDPGWLGLAARVGCDIDLSVHIAPACQRDVMRRIDQAERQIAGQRDDADGSDPAAERHQRWQAEDTAQLAEALREREGYFRMSAFWALSAGDSESLSAARSELAREFSATGLIGAGAVGYQREAFETTLPLGRERLTRRRGITTSPLAAAIPMAGRGVIDPDGWLVGACGWGGGPKGPFVINPFGDSYENPHLAVLGQSGSGKTHLARLIALSAWLSGAEVAILDPKDEYAALARRCQGSPIRLELGGATAMNVFDAARGGDDRAFARGLGDLARYWRSAVGRISDHQAALLDAAIARVCEPLAPGQPATTTPVAKDLADELSRTGQGGGPEFLPAQDLAQRVRRFAGPALGRLLGSPTNVNLDNDFLLFQLASLRSQDIDLYVLAVRLCLLSLNRWLDRPADRKLILVDEAWSLLQDESGARFLLDLAKTARARGAMLLLVTQDSADFAANSLGKSILANCAASIIFRQHHAHSQVLGEMFDLDRALSARIGSLGRGQALAALSGGQRVRIETFNHPW